MTANLAHEAVSARSDEHWLAARRLAIGILIAAAILAALLSGAPSLGPVSQYAMTLEPASSSGDLRAHLAPDRPIERSTIYMPAAGLQTELFIDGDGIAPALSEASGFGFASRSFLFASLAPQVLSNATVISIKIKQDHGRIGASRLFLAPNVAAREAALRQIEWARRNQVLSIGVAAAAAFIFMMRLGRSATGFATGPLAVLSYIVIAQALARHSDVADYFGRFIDGAEYLLAIGAAFAVASLARSVADAGPARRWAHALLLLACLFVLASDESRGVWLPAALTAPLVCLAIFRVGRRLLATPVYSAISLATMLIAIAWAAFTLMRAAEPSRFNESFAFATFHSLGALPLLFVGAVGAVRESSDERRESMARLKKDYAAQSAELGRLNVVLQEEAKRRMLLEERSRITRDMHDGIGGRLLSLLVRVRTGRLDIKEVEREVQESLNDLRLIVDSLDNAGDSLDAALSSFRGRAEHQLTAASIRLDWMEEEHALQGVNLDPHATLNIFRILQEALANIVCHAGAKAVTISIARDGVGKELRIVVSDDGRGLFEPRARNGGKGLKHMAARAEALGARLTIEGERGCRVSLEIPLNAAAQASGSSSQPD